MSVEIIDAPVEVLARLVAPGPGKTPAVSSRQVTHHPDRLDQVELAFKVPGLTVHTTGQKGGLKKGKVPGLTVRKTGTKPGLRRGGKVPGLTVHVTGGGQGATGGKRGGLAKGKVPGLTIHSTTPTGPSRGRPGAASGKSSTGFGGKKVPGLIVHQGATGAGTGKKPTYFLKGQTVHNVSQSTGKAKKIGHLTVHAGGVTAHGPGAVKSTHPTKQAAAKAIASRHALKGGKAPGLTIHTVGKGKARK